MTASRDDRTTLLSVEGLGISFGGLKAVNDVSFAVKPGEIVSVIGPNGAGKTTLFNMISGVYQPGAGRISLNGEEVTGMEPHLLARRGMSRTFQNLQIFQSMTVLENAISGFHLQERGSVLADLLGLPASRRRAGAAEEGARKLLARVRLAEAADREAGNLSYGSLKRLEIARAMASQPKILLLDEPAAGIPAAESAGLFSVIAALPREVTVLFIEHDMDLVFRFAERITVLVGGRVLTEGAPSEIAKDARVREVYLGEAQHA